MAEKAQPGATRSARAQRVMALLPDKQPAVRVRLNGGGERVYRARLLAGTDGRTSMCRSWRDFRVQRDPDGMVIAGLLAEGIAAPEDTMSTYIAPRLGMISLTVPPGRRFRLACGAP